MLYSRRSKFDPLWNTVVIGGYNDGRRYGIIRDKILRLASYGNTFFSFLGRVDKIGTAFEADSVATGYGAYIAQVRNLQRFWYFAANLVIFLLNVEMTNYIETSDLHIHIRSLAFIAESIGGKAGYSH